MSLPNLVRGGFGSHEFRVGDVQVYRIHEVIPEVETACLNVAAAGFGRDTQDSDFAADVLNHIRVGSLFLAMEEDRPVAFRMLQQPRQDVVYLAGAAKRPGSQRHLVREMTEEIIRRNGETSAIVTRTASDFVADEMLHLCRSVVPINGAVTEKELGLLKDVGLYPEGMDSQTLVIPNYYGGQSMLNPNRGRPRSRNEDVARFMRSVMSDEEYFDGGAIMMVGKGLKI